MSAVCRELWLLGRDRSACLWLVIALLLSALAVTSGVREVQAQRATLESMLEADRRERSAATNGQPDWGSVAYYSFHLTYSPPSAMAFAALGQRDLVAWKHRVRMLALEGQIHEADAGHPELALVGRLDFAFVATLLAPLLIILLLHDLQASERAAGRFELLAASAGSAAALWRLRAALRTGLLGVAVVLPLIVGGLVEASPADRLAGAVVIVLLHLGFWAVLCHRVDHRPWDATLKLTVLIGVWLLLSILLPAAMKPLIERVHPVPSGADILLTQREAVNDAWDLPKEATMQAFVARYPEWAAQAQVSRPFEWKWYYAFQEVGDLQAAPLSQAYTSGQRLRDDLAGTLAWLSPPAMAARQLQALAGTDVTATLAYEQSVRDFHAGLRAWYYPRLFSDAPFDPADLADRPEYVPQGLQPMDDSSR